MCFDVFVSLRQKRPTKVSKVTYYSVKRDLLQVRARVLMYVYLCVCHVVVCGGGGGMCVCLCVSVWLGSCCSDTRRLLRSSWRTIMTSFSPNFWIFSRAKTILPNANCCGSWHVHSKKYSIQCLYTKKEKRKLSYQTPIAAALGTCILKSTPYNACTPKKKKENYLTRRQLLRLLARAF